MSWKGQERRANPPSRRQDDMGNGTTKWIMGIIAALLVFGVTAWASSVNTELKELNGEVEGLKPTIAVLTERVATLTASVNKLNATIEKMEPAAAADRRR